MSGTKVTEELTKGILRLPLDDHRQLKARAAMQGITLQQAVIMAVKKSLDLPVDEQGPAVPKKLRPYLAMVVDVFTGGDPDAISLLTTAARFAHQNSSGAATDRKREVIR